MHMKLEDVKYMSRRERRTCRANLRLYPSQMKFIDDNGLSVQAIFDKALDELGHEIPAPGDIEKIARLYGVSQSRGHGRGGRGNIRAQKMRARRRR